VKTNRFFFLSLALFGLVIAGCSSSVDPPVNTDPPPPPPPATPPTFDSIDVPSWPPIGKDDYVEVRLSDDEALSRITATFNDAWRETLTGRTGTVRFTGRQLGEGMGTLTLTACDTRSTCREKKITDLVVDLSAPEIELERAVVSPRLEGIDGQIAVWVSDAWVLGSVDVTFQGKTFHQEFPKKFPATIGKQWDVSRVAFPASTLPEGSGTATIVARDAAGNERKLVADLRIDATAPIVAIAEPAANATVSGQFSVKVNASDDSKVTPNLELWVGGARVYDSVATTAPIFVDASTLPPGPTEIRAIAHDEAGNASVAAKVMVNVAP
jgi:hypothetical protein